MPQKTKIIASAVAAVLALVIVVSSVTALVKKDDNNAPVVNPSAATSSQAGTDATTTTAAPTTPAPTDLKTQILGKWMDSAQMSGYEFHADGSVDVTYVNLTIPILNIPINGTAKGSYTLEGDKLKVAFSIYKGTIDDTFTAKMEGNSLVLNGKDGTATYNKVTANAPTTTYAPVEYDDDELTGSWVNADASVQYTFNANGAAQVRLSSGTYSGAYIIQDDQITIQYSANGETITQKFTYAVSMNSMSLTDKDENLTIWIRSGTEFAPSTSPASLIGKWNDGAGLSGFEFLEGNIVNVTYVNITIPVLNMPINGTYTGVYNLNGDQITITYTVAGQTISNTYTYSVAGSTLTLTNVADGEVKSYSK